MRRNSVDGTFSDHASSTSGIEGLIGLLLGSVGGVMLLAGIIGRGVASAAIRPALDLLIDADPQCQRWATDADRPAVSDPGATV